MKNITKRDIKAFFLGMVALLLIEIAFDFDGTVGDFIRGFNDGFNSTTSSK